MTVDSTTQTYAGRVAGSPQAGGGEPSRTPVLDREAAWKQSFRDTLAEILDAGFRTYSDEIREEKLEEMRREILEMMGLTEEDLANMPADQRNAIEQMIAGEIRMRLAAEKGLEAEDAAAGTHDAYLGSQLRAAPDRIAGGELLLDLFQPPETPDPETPTG